MGLADYLDRAPDANRGNQLLQQGAQSFARMPMDAAQLQQQQLQNTGLQQANTDAAYTAPGAPASPEGNAIGQYIKSHMRGTPGWTPEHEQRLIAELTGGGAPGGQPQGGLQGPQARGPEAGAQGPQYAPTALGQTPVSQGLGGGVAPQMPRPNSDQTNYLGKPATPSLGQGNFGTYDRPSSMGYAGDMTGMAGVPKVNVVPQGPQAGATPAAGGPMTNRDVEQYQRMAPFLKLDQGPREDPRMAIANQKDRLARDQMAQKQNFLDQEDRLKRELARLSANVSLANGNAQQKAILQQMKMVNDLRIANIRAMGQQTSGIGGVVNQGATQQAMGQERNDMAASLQEAEDLGRKLDAAIAGGAGITTGGKVKVVGPQGPKGKDTTQIRIERNGQPGTIEAWEFDPKTDVRK